MNFVSPSAITGKIAGQFFTPENVARSLVSWVVRSPSDRLLDPSCGDGSILSHHTNCFGIERDPYSAWSARERLPGQQIENTDFFTWAASTIERFDCAAGNPPFIRFQNFKGLSKAAAEAICAANGVKLSGLSSTWAAFLVATAGLLKNGSRMAFVVPAEIGHAPYAINLIEFLLSTFSKVQVIAIKSKIFPRLSEDCWLLWCEGKGGRSSVIELTKVDRFIPSAAPPALSEAIRWEEVRSNWNGRLRALLISEQARALYAQTRSDSGSRRFGDFAKIGIGHITGDNAFFHLSPSAASKQGIPREFLIPTARKGSSLTSDVVDGRTVEQWIAADEACFLLSLPATAALPKTIKLYLESDDGLVAQKAYKCRTRKPWYSVPGVVRPDYLLQYMAGNEVRLSRNEARVACSNSLHAVRIFEDDLAKRCLPIWGAPFVKLSCEIEGHPLGGGMLKLEPREAAQIVFPPAVDEPASNVILEALDELRAWRHQRAG